MSRRHFKLHGRTRGAIGIMHPLGCVTLETGTPQDPQNVEAIYSKFDHVSYQETATCDACGFVITPDVSETSCDCQKGGSNA